MALLCRLICVKNVTITDESVAIDGIFQLAL